MEPWDYDDHNLLALCAECHKVWHDANKYFRSEIAANLSAGDLKMLMGNLKVGLDLCQHDIVGMAKAIAMIGGDTTTRAILKARFDAK